VLIIETIKGMTLVRKKFTKKVDNAIMGVAL
jgi:hypothetical protein